jgi:hypothetical protein
MWKSFEQFEENCGKRGKHVKQNVRRPGETVGDVSSKLLVHNNNILIYPGGTIW